VNFKTSQILNPSLYSFSERKGIIKLKNYLVSSLLDCFLNLLKNLPFWHILLPLDYRPNVGFIVLA
jgi:hypothetical protein